MGANGSLAGGLAVFTTSSIISQTLAVGGDAQNNTYVIQSDPIIVFSCFQFSAVINLRSCAS